MSYNAYHPIEPGQERTSVFEPAAMPELFFDVRRKRIMAFVIDYGVIALVSLFAAIPVFLFGLLTFGLGWLLFTILVPVIAMAYVAFTLGGPASATPGMAIMGLEMRLWHGGKVYPLLAIVHFLGFALSISALTPLVLLVCLLNDQKRCLHDLVLGTVVINRPL